MNEQLNYKTMSPKAKKLDEEFATAIARFNQLKEYNINSDDTSYITEIAIMTCEKCQTNFAELNRRNIL